MIDGRLRPGLLALALVALISTCLAPTVLADGSGYGWKPEELNWDGISQRRINDTRADAGVNLLEADNYLWSLAEERARDMLEREYLDYQTPEGLDAGAYMRKDGARYDSWAELRADDTSGDPQEKVAWRVIDNFLNDKSARTAIIGDFDRLGVAMAENNARRVYVILLGKKAAPPPTATPKPAPRAQSSGGSIVDIISAAANRYGVDPGFLVRLARCESGLNPRAYNPAGPYIGLFQFSQSTFSSYGGSNIYDPADQSDVAARMIARGLASHWPVCSRQ